MAFPGRASEVLALQPRSAGTKLRADAGGPAGERSLLASLDQQLRALLQVASGKEALACALVSAGVRGRSDGWLGTLLSPVLEEGYDYVCPSYVRGRYEGAINNAIVYPVMRALFGLRLRQPLGEELAVSRRFADQLLRDQAWKTDPMRAGTDVWLVSKALTEGARLCQVFLGKATLPPPLHQELADVLAGVVGVVFAELERHAAAWQRISGSQPVRTFGEERVEDEEPPADVAREVAAFRLGCSNLMDLWGAVLPPATLLALTHAARLDVRAFALDADLWARVVYDFAVGYRVRTIHRAQLLRSMVPLYLGWVASFVNQVRAQDAAGAAETIERGCQAFERQKPYLISRWRWPDRFSP